MTSAIFYDTDGFRVNKDKIMGRQVAGNTFLKAFIKYIKDRDIYIYSKTNIQAEDFYKFVKSEGIDKNIKFINFQNTILLNKPGLLFYPGPDIALQSKNRSLYKEASWSICGITHTTSSAGVMRSIEALVTAPIKPWDAIICTSNAVKSNVLKIIEAEEHNLKNRFNASNFTRPQLPIIPLGVNTSDYMFNDIEKVNARNILGIENDEIPVLYVGRLSFHAKANPFPMYKSLEIVANQLDRKIVLIECGFYHNKSIREAFDNAVRYIAPKIRRIYVDGTDNNLKSNCYAAAQIFCSFSDNIQETFGITPIEAMAAGLPVVVSDWNGYRETVRDGIDGFCIPTLMPPAGYGSDLSKRYALNIDNYDRYLGNTSNFISIDIEKATAAFKRLITNDKLRNEMGLNARKRANEKFDWDKIILQYSELWDNLKLNRSQTLQKSYTYTWAEKLDPYYAFSNYPTNIISDKTFIKITDESAQEGLKTFKSLKKLSMINYANYVIPESEFVKKLFNFIDGNQKQVIDVKKYFDKVNSIYLVRSLLWLNKYYLIDLVQAKK